MYQLGAFSLSVNVAEKNKGIIRRCCRPTTGSGRNEEDKRVKLIGYPFVAIVVVVVIAVVVVVVVVVVVGVVVILIFRTCPGRPSIAANTFRRRAWSFWTPTTTGDRCGYRGASRTRIGCTPQFQPK